MIIVRSPQRISIGGGGTDLHSYYSLYGGKFISAAIDKYVYVSIIRPFKKGIYLKYSDHEKIININEIRHPIFREVLKKYDPKNNQIEITTLADIPSGTGLGSSGSFTTALIKSLKAYNLDDISKEELAEAACEIEIEKLKEPVGKQDQYISSFGGIKEFEIDREGRVSVQNLKISKSTTIDLEENLLLFFTGFTRKAGDILNDQDTRTKKSDNAIIDQLHFVKETSQNIKNCLESGDTKQFGKYMHEHWHEKKKRSKNMSNSDIDRFYKIALDNGAVGGKVVGAGGGGFLMFYATDSKLLRKKLSNEGLEELKFRFDYEGAKQINL